MSGSSRKFQSDSRSPTRRSASKKKRSSNSLSPSPSSKFAEFYTVPSPSSIPLPSFISAPQHGTIGSPLSGQARSPSSILSVLFPPVPSPDFSSAIDRFEAPVSSSSSSNVLHTTLSIDPSSALPAPSPPLDPSLASSLFAQPSPFPLSPHYRFSHSSPWDSSYVSPQQSQLLSAASQPLQVDAGPSATIEVAWKQLEQKLQQLHQQEPQHQLQQPPSVSSSLTAAAPVPPPSRLLSPNHLSLQFKRDMLQQQSPEKPQQSSSQSQSGMLLQSDIRKCFIHLLTRVPSAFSSASSSSSSSDSLHPRVVRLMFLKHEKNSSSSSSSSSSISSASVDVPNPANSSLLSSSSSTFVESPSFSRFLFTAPSRITDLPSTSASAFCSAALSPSFSTFASFSSSACVSSTPLIPRHIASFSPPDPPRQSISQSFTQSQHSLLRPQSALEYFTDHNFPISSTFTACFRPVSAQNPLPPELASSLAVFSRQSPGSVSSSASLIASAFSSSLHHSRTISQRFSSPYSSSASSSLSSSSLASAFPSFHTQPPQQHRRSQSLNSTLPQTQASAASPSRVHLSAFSAASTPSVTPSPTSLSFFSLSPFSSASFPLPSSSSSASTLSLPSSFSVSRPLSNASQDGLLRLKKLLSLPSP